MNQTSKKPNKPQPPLSGLAVAATLGLWGAVAFYAPTYLNIVGGWRVPFNIVGAVTLTISLGGALIELGKLSRRKNEAMSYWGISVVFLVPAGILFTLVELYSLSAAAETVAKVAALLLLAVGGPFVFFGGAHFFWHKNQQASQVTEGISEKQVASQKTTKREERFKTIAATTIASLSLATAVVKFVFEMLP